MVCLIIVIKSGGSDQPGSLHVYQANTFPTVVTHINVIQLICDSNRTTVRSSRLDTAQLLEKLRVVVNPRMSEGLATTRAPEIGGGYCYRRTGNGGQVVHAYIIIKKLSRTWPLFKIIERFSTCVGRLRVASGLWAPVAAVWAGRRPVAAGLVCRVRAVARGVVRVIGRRLGARAAGLPHVRRPARCPRSSRPRTTSRVHVTCAIHIDTL